MLRSIENFFAYKDAKKINSELFNSSGWSFTGRSKEDSEPSFWYHEMYDLEEIKNLFIERIEANGFRLNNIHAFYANGQSHGQCGSYHQDSKDTNNITLIYYANDEWNSSWGGATTFLDERRKPLETIYPDFNKAVIFTSTILHAGLEPTSLFKGLRVTAALKFSTHINL